MYTDANIYIYVCVCIFTIIAIINIIMCLYIWYSYTFSPPRSHLLPSLSISLFSPFPSPSYIYRRTNIESNKKKKCECGVDKISGKYIWCSVKIIV